MTVNINDQDVQVADSWNELSHTELLTLYNLLVEQVPGFFYTREEIPVFLRIEAGKYLLRLDQHFLGRWEADCKASDKEIGALIFKEELKDVMYTVTDFLFNEKEEVRLELTRNPYPRIIRKKGGFLYGPKDGLDNISLYELGTTFSIFDRYLKTQDEQHLLKLLAILYRPGKQRTTYNRRSGYQGDRRLPYFDHESTVDARIEIVAQWPTMVKGLLFFWFASCRQHIVNSYPNVFRQETNKLERVGNDYGWGGILMSMAEGIINLRSVGEQNYKTGLTYLSFLEDQRLAAEMRKRSGGH